MSLENLEPIQNQDIEGRMNLEKPKSDSHNISTQLDRHIKSNGFNFYPDIWDGEFHDFDDGEKKGWYKAEIVALANGKQKLRCIYNSWIRKNNREPSFSFQSAGDYSREDDENFDQQQKENEERRVKQKIEEQLLAKNVASLLWERALKDSPATETYITKKKLASSHGARFHPEEPSKVLLPCYSLDGELWGIQEIPLNGKKRVSPGQKFSGTCFPLGELNGAKRAYLAEGFATAATVHEATGLPVVTCFFADNLPTIAAQLKIKFPALEFIIAGDDDVASSGNRGRTCAEAAAKILGTVAVFPTMENMGKDRSDWNDKACLEGVESVKSGLLSAEAMAKANLEKSARLEYVEPLGFKGPVYYYISSSNRQINQINAHKEIDLLKLMPKDYWMREFPKNNSKGITVDVDWRSAQSVLMQRCRDRGIFQNKRIRGRGVWREGTKVVVHLGDRLYYDGADHDLRGIADSRYIYEYSAPLPLVPKATLTVGELEWFIKLLGLFNYKRREQRYFLGGWLAIAIVCGAFRWRPHLWLTGEFGSGKSTILNYLVKRLLRPIDFLFALAGTTEAGARQTIGSDAVPIVFDEFESETNKTANIIDSLLAFMRQASSDDGAEIFKGTAGGAPQKYLARFSALVSAITPRLLTPQDRSRFTLVEVEKVELGSKTAKDTIAEIEELISQLDDDFAMRFFGRMITMIPVIEANQRLFEVEFAKKKDRRFGQQYGTLLAGWSALISDYVLTSEQVKALVDEIEIEKEVSGTNENAHEACIQYLLNKLITVQQSTSSGSRTLKISILDLIQKYGANRADLRQIGILVIEHGKAKEPMLFVCGETHPETKALFRGSRWEADWRTTLSRFPGAVNGYQPERGGVKVPRGVLIPIDLIIKGWRRNSDLNAQVDEMPEAFIERLQSQSIDHRLGETAESLLEYESEKIE